MSKYHRPPFFERKTSLHGFKEVWMIDDTHEIFKATCSPLERVKKGVRVERTSYGCIRSISVMDICEMICSIYHLRI